MYVAMLPDIVMSTLSGGFEHRPSSYLVEGHCPSTVEGLGTLDDVIF
jgi:hypothetical protein